MLKTSTKNGYQNSKNKRRKRTQTSKNLQHQSSTSKDIYQSKGEDIEELDSIDSSDDSFCEDDYEIEHWESPLESDDDSELL